MKLFGMILVIAGVICFAIPTITFYTKERVVDAGFFRIDVDKPHTIFLNPAAGILMVMAGVIMLVFAQRKGASA